MLKTVMFSVSLGSYPRVTALSRTVRSIAGAVEKIAVLTACRALVGRAVGVKFVTAVAASPFGHDRSPFHMGCRTERRRPVGGFTAFPTYYAWAFQWPCRLQYSLAVTREASTMKTASGAWPGSRKRR